MKKNYFVRALLLILISLISVLPTRAQFSGSGSGTDDDPYLIFNETQLAQVSNFLNQDSVVFRLMKDLDLTAWIAENNPRQGWLPIGVESMPFMGKFLGNNHKITGLMINRSSTDYVGFFGYLSNATIENLSIEGSSVTGSSCVGGFIGYSIGSEITNCNLTLSASIGVEGTNNVGGFVGQSYNSNYFSFSVNASVQAQSILGGFVGLAEGGTFQYGNIIGQYVSSGNYTGGFLGKMTGVVISDIDLKGDVRGQDYTGGFAGCCSTGYFSNCNVESNVDGSQFVSGFIGSLENTTSSFNNIYHKGTISASGDYLGGIVGVSNGGCIEEMESCCHFGDITGKNYVGGLIGATLNIVEEPVLHTYKNSRSVSSSYGTYYYEQIYSGSALTKNVNNCTSIGNIVGESFIGGIIGSTIASKGYTPEAHTGPVTWFNKPQGLVNYYFDENGNNLGTTITYYYYYRNTIDLSVTNNYYCGTIQGLNNVGGLVGYKSGGAIYNNYVNSNIFGALDVGGIVGHVSDEKDGNYQATTILKSNVSILGTISATTENVGRIYGLISPETTIIGDLGSSESNRALTQAHVILSGIAQDINDDLQNGTSIGPSALKLKANYVSWGWNFDENWDILETESFPYKKYQAAPPVIESNLISQATSISGKSVDGGTVYLFYKDRDAVSTESSNFRWSFDTEPLQSGAIVQIYADVEGMAPSYFTTATVGYPGSGTEDDPWRIYTAEDLQGASNRGNYKVMNDIDLTSWIDENNPENGWVPIGRNSGDVTFIDGDGHTISGLWINTTDNYNGLFSNFSTGQIKNLTVEVASGKRIKGSDFTGILIGRNANGSIINCSVKGDVEGTIHVGGIAGYTLSTSIYNDEFDGSVSSGSDNAYVGGLVGLAEDCTVSICRSNSTVTATNSNNQVGGLIGCTVGGSIDKSIANTILSTSSVDGHVGGLIGHCESVVTQSLSKGSVSATGNNSYTGGLIGYALSPISDCYSTVDVEGTLFTAGLVGYTFNSIDRCYATGDIYGVIYGAGVVGELDGMNASLTNSVAANNILSLSAQSSWGSRVIGGFKNGAADPDLSNYALSTMQVSLNNVPQNKTDDLVEGIAKTIEELNQQVTYVGLDWDMENVWGIDEGQGYPYLLALSGNEPSSDQLLGDANGDGSVTITDVVLAAQFAVGKTPSVFIEENGDVNGDGNINITDVVIIANIAVGKTTMTRKATAVMTESSDQLVASPIEIKANETQIIEVSLDNSVAYSGFQMDVNLPEGVELVDIQLTDRAIEHSFITGDILGKKRILGFSAGNEPIDGSSGSLLVLTVKANNAIINDEVLWLNDILFVEPNGTTHHFDDTPLTVSVITFVNELQSNNVKIYGDDDQIVIESEMDGRAMIAYPDGRSRWITISAGHNVVTVQRGIYIVKFGDKVVKINI